MWRAYWELARLHLWPVGNILIFWPCVWTLMLGASSSQLTQYELVLWTAFLALGSTLLHSAACVLNDICDVDFDRQVGPRVNGMSAIVARTKNRPLVTGQITMSSAVAWLGFLTGSYLWMLTLLNTTAAVYGILGVFPFHAMYPLMKRWTWWPQAWLGFAMNWGAWVVWFSLEDHVEGSGMWPFFLGLVSWTVLYDTIYACQDRKDDADVGVKSTALLFGNLVRPILCCFALVFLASLTYMGYCNDKGAAFYVISCGGASAHVTWQLATWDPDDPKDCGAKFKSNGDMGYIIWAGLLLNFWFEG